MTANIDISRARDSEDPIKFTIVDDQGEPVDITGWTDFELVPLIDPAKEYARYVTFDDTAGGTFQRAVRVIVGEPAIKTGTVLTIRAVPTGNPLSNAKGIKVFLADQILTQSAETDDLGRLPLSIAGEVGDSARLFIQTEQGELTSARTVVLEDISEVE